MGIIRIRQTCGHTMEHVVLDTYFTDRDYLCLDCVPCLDCCHRQLAEAQAELDKLDRRKEERRKKCYISKR